MWIGKNYFVFSQKLKSCRRSIYGYCTSIVKKICRRSIYGYCTSIVGEPIIISLQRSRLTTVERYFCRKGCFHSPRRGRSEVSSSVSQQSDQARNQKLCKGGGGRGMGRSICISQYIQILVLACKRESNFLAYIPELAQQLNYRSGYGKISCWIKWTTRIFCRFQWWKTSPWINIHYI